VIALWEALADGSLAGTAMLGVICIAILIGRHLRRDPVPRRGTRRHREDFAHETTDGVPLGLSADYDRLPMIERPYAYYCMTCDALHLDGERRMSNGSHVLAMMCRDCREVGRARWIAEHGADLPRAVARHR